MSAAELVFILFFLTAAATALRVVARLATRRWRDARRLAAKLGVAAILYLAVVVVVSLFSPRRWVALGEEQRFDDWALTVLRAETTPTGWRLVARVANRGRGRAQSAPDAELLLVADDGRMFAPAAVPAGRSLRSMVAPGDSFETVLGFAVPSGSPSWGPTSSTAHGRRGSSSATAGASSIAGLSSACRPARGDRPYAQCSPRRAATVPAACAGDPAGPARPRPQHPARLAGGAVRRESGSGAPKERRLSHREVRGHGDPSAATLRAGGRTHRPHVRALRHLLPADDPRLLITLRDGSTVLASRAASVSGGGSCRRHKRRPFFPARSRGGKEKRPRPADVAPASAPSGLQPAARPAGSRIGPSASSGSSLSRTLRTRSRQMIGISPNARR